MPAAGGLAATTLVTMVAMVALGVVVPEAGQMGAKAVWRLPDRAMTVEVVEQVEQSPPEEAAAGRQRPGPVLYRIMAVMVVMGLLITSADRQ